MQNTLLHHVKYTELAFLTKCYFMVYKDSITSLTIYEFIATYIQMHRSVSRQNEKYIFPSF